MSKNPYSIDLVEQNLRRLRPGQRGAIHALLAYGTTASKNAALLTLPTGYGKSELIAIAPVIFKAKRTLVVAPSKIVRSQLAARIKNQQYLREAGVIPPTVAKPNVHSVTTKVADWQSLEQFDVLVGHPQSISPSCEGVAVPPDKFFDLIVFDESHHLPSRSWSAILDASPNARKIGFSATQFRRDRKRIPGNQIYDYPIHLAVEEGYFAQIRYEKVVSGNQRAERDRSVAEAVLKEHQLRNKTLRTARILIRVDEIKRAQELAQLYSTVDPLVRIEVVTHETTSKEYEELAGRLESGDSSGVAFVGVLGEGFDLPTLKLIAYHDPHKSLPATIQLAGRVARPSGNEQAVVFAAQSSTGQIVQELHAEGQRWDVVIPDLASDFQSQPQHDTSQVDWFALEEAFTEENFKPYTLAQITNLSNRLDQDSFTKKISEGTTFRYEGPSQEIRVIKSIENAKKNTYGVLLERKHKLTWLSETPKAYLEVNHLVLSFTKDNKRLFCRSTLPAETTNLLIRDLIGEVHPLPSAKIAKSYPDVFETGSFSTVGQRSIHKTIAHHKSYQTSFGNSVEKSITPLDSALNAAGHFVAKSANTPATAVGIAVDKSKVWEHRNSSLDEYRQFVENIDSCLDEGEPARQTIAGLRVPSLPPTELPNPIAFILDYRLDASGSVQFEPESQEVIGLSAIRLVPSKPSPSSINVDLTDHEERTISQITIDTNKGMITAPGKLLNGEDSQDFGEALTNYPPTLFFDDGSMLLGATEYFDPPAMSGDHFPLSDQIPVLDKKPYKNLTADNRILTVVGGTEHLPEKARQANNKAKPLKIETRLKRLNELKQGHNPKSILQSVTNQLRDEKADFIFCDDEAGEVADLIAVWAQYGGRSTPHIRFIHCKAKKPQEVKGKKGKSFKRTTSAVAVLTEVVEQTISSNDYLLKLDMLTSHLRNRHQKRPNRLIHGTLETLDTILTGSMTEVTKEIWIYHPGVSATKLAKGKSKSLGLLGSTRTHLKNFGVELALVAEI